MSYEETAVEIERATEKFNKAKTVNRFTALCLWYHVNYCQKSPCNNFLLNIDWLSSDEIIYFQNYCRQHYNEFYHLFKFLKSIAAIEREKINLEIKLNKFTTEWIVNTKIYQESNLIKKLNFILQGNNFYFF